MSLLKKNPTRIKKLSKNEDEIQSAMKDGQKELRQLQEKLYAERNWSVLIVLQGMDTAGKDGLVEHVMKEISPMGCSAHNFKKPTSDEIDHDFLWRTQLKLPPRGHIGIFNRSYYEDVIVPFVHPEILEQAPIPSKSKTKKVLEERCEDIVNYEKYLTRQGTSIIKIFLHLSKSEQKERLRRRLDLPDKKWKFDEQDLIERGFWNDYQKAYDFCLKATDHKDAPWTIIPADDKPTTLLIALELIVRNLRSLKMDFPKPNKAKKKLLERYRRDLK